MDNFEQTSKLIGLSIEQMQNMTTEQINTYRVNSKFHKSIGINMYDMFDNDEQIMKIENKMEEI